MFTTPHLLLLLLAAAAAAAAAASSPTHDVAAQFHAAGIVPDILPRFAPSALAFLTFPFSNGSSLTLASAGVRLGRDGTAPNPHTAQRKLTRRTTDAQLAPTVSLVGLRADDAQRYVGLVVDPDAPSRADPSRRSIRHYFAADLRVGGGRTLVNTTAAANEFRGPNPPAGSGPHRLVGWLVGCWFLVLTEVDMCSCCTASRGCSIMGSWTSRIARRSMCLRLRRARGSGILWRGRILWRRSRVLLVD